MAHKVSISRALYFTKLSVYLSCSWPPPSSATKWATTKYNVIWCISFLSALSLFFPLILTVVKFHSNVFLVTQTACFMGAVFNLLLKMIVYRLHIKRTQTAIYEMEDFLKNARPHEKIIIQRYVDRCWAFHAVITAVNYLATAMGVTAPLLNADQLFPTGAVYPFSYESGIPMYLIYIHQAFAGFQCSSGVTIDCQAALMLWFAGARLEILAQELGDVYDVRTLRSFVHKHRKLLSYAYEVSHTMSYVAIGSSTACGIAAITSSLQLFGDHPLTVKLQFGPIALIATMNLFICAWPADNLLRVCDLLANAVYNTPWIDMSMNMMKSILVVLVRCQQPVVVSVAGFLPRLSLRSYASVGFETFQDPTFFPPAYNSNYGGRPYHRPCPSNRQYLLSAGKCTLS